MKIWPTVPLRNERTFLGQIFIPMVTSMVLSVMCLKYSPIETGEGGEEKWKKNTHQTLRESLKFDFASYDCAWPCFNRIDWPNNVYKMRMSILSWKTTHLKGLCRPKIGWSVPLKHYKSSYGCAGMDWIKNIFYRSIIFTKY